MTWEFWIDRGGTFTDCIGLAPDGALHVFKRLSSDTAPVEGIRAILERAGTIGAGAPLPACRVRLGTTVATNALLERRGAPTLLVASRGLGGRHPRRARGRGHAGGRPGRPPTAPPGAVRVAAEDRGAFV